MSLRPEIEGPTRIYGYDGSVDPANATASEWRGFRVRKAREKGAHTHLEWIVLRNVFGECTRCGKDSERLSKDHVVSLYNGGCDCIANIQPLCRRCNSVEGASCNDYRSTAHPYWVTEYLRAIEKATS